MAMPPEQSRLAMAPGRRLGVYEIVSPIGAGGMGEVYLARDTRLGRDVALKILPRALNSDPDRLARFEREARMLAALNHPNIATIHGVEESDGITALVLELVAGETLEKKIRHPYFAREGPGSQLLTTCSLVRGNSCFRFATRMRCPSGDKAHEGPGLSLNCVCRISRGCRNSNMGPSRTFALNQRLPLR